MVAVKKYHLTLNRKKCSYNLKSIKLLGYIVKNGTMMLDLEQLKHLMELPVPGNMPTLRWALSMFAHYSQWVASLKKKKKKKLHPLMQVSTFPLFCPTIKAFQNMKRDIANSTISAVDPFILLIVETDASICAIAALLRQSIRLVAFFSRKLSQFEWQHSAIEKEAYAIVEASRKWKH